MLLVYTHQITPRLTYTFKHICQKILNTKVGFTSTIEDFIAHTDIKMSYTKQPLSNELFIRSHDLLFEQGITDITITPQPWKKTQGFFATGKRSDLPFDIFASSFYLLSRYEEYLPHVKDAYGRFPAEESIAYKHHFLHQPVIDLWALELKTIIEQRFPDYQFPGRSYNVQPVIDVPMAFNYKYKGLFRTLGGTLSDLTKFKFKDIYQRFLVILSIKRDPYNTFKWIINKQKSFPKSQFIILFLIGNYSTYDKNINSNKKQFISLIKHMADYCKVGLKASYFALANNSTLKKEKLKFQSITNRPLDSVRHSFSKLNLPQSYRNLIELEIYNDYTMGYYNHIGFRAGTCTPFPFYDMDYETHTPLQIHPFQCMDFSLLQYQSQLDKTQNLQKIIDEIKAVNGTFTFVFHNYTFSNLAPWENFKALFQYIMKTIND